MEEAVKAYAAGIMDGEGSVMYDREKSTSPYRRPSVSVTSTSYELVDFMKQNFGGHICSHKTYKAHHKPHWSWRLKADKALSFLENIRPYLLEKEKCRRADLLLIHHKNVTPRNGKYTSDLHLAKLQLEEEFFHPSEP
jgi:hypothetical protein